MIISYACNSPRAAIRILGLFFYMQVKTCTNRFRYRRGKKFILLKRCVIKVENLQQAEAAEKILSGQGMISVQGDPRIGDLGDGGMNHVIVVRRHAYSEAHFGLNTLGEIISVHYLDEILFALAVAALFWATPRLTVTFELKLPA